MLAKNFSFTNKAAHLTMENSSCNPCVQLDGAVPMHVLDQFVVQCHRTDDNNRISLRTLLHRFLASQLKTYGYAFSQLVQLLNNSTPVHRDVRAIFLQFLPHTEENLTLLAQDFIHDDKMSKLIKHMTKYTEKKGQPRMLYKLLATDGFIAHKLNNGPLYDSKRYWPNLQYGLEDVPSLYDEENTVRENHVRAIRAVYDVLEDNKHLLGCDKRGYRTVYYTLYHVVQKEEGFDLPEPGEPIHAELLEKTAKAYMEVMGEENLHSMVEKVRERFGEEVKLTPDEETSSSALVPKKRKRQRKHGILK